MRDQLFHLDARAGATLQTQLRQMLVAAIREGQLPPGSALPSCRKLADTLSDAELLELPGRELLRRLFHQEDVRLFEPAPVFFQCTCSRERVAGILRSLGRGELEQLLVEQKRVEVRCEFCNRGYRFDAVDVASLFAETAGARAPGLH